MLRYLSKVVLFLVLGVVLVDPLSRRILPQSPLTKHPMSDIVALSEKPAKWQTVVVGDSVAEQFVRTAPDVLDLTNFQAPSVAGQYALVHNALRSQARSLKKIILFYGPQSFNCDLDQVFTYRYFVLPFVDLRSMNIFSWRTYAKLLRRPLFVFGALYAGKTSSLIDDVDYSAFDPDPTPIEPLSLRRAFLSDTSIVYLRRIKEECDRRGIEFYVTYPPMSEKANRDFTKIRAQIHELGLESFMEDFSAIEVLPDSDFVDHLHLTQTAVIRMRDKVLARLDAPRAAAARRGGDSR